MHRPSFPFIASGLLFEEFSHHRLQIAAFSNIMSFGSVRAKDIVVFIQDSAGTSSDGLLPQCEVI